MVRFECLVSSLLFTAVSLLIPAYGSVNLLTNPGFETGNISGWAAFGGSISAVTEPHTGTYSALVSNRTATWNGIRQSMMGLISDGQTCTISGWVKLQNASSDSVGLTIKQTDNGGTHYNRINTATVNDDIWTYMYGDFTLDVNGVLTDLFLYFEGPDPNVNFYVDDVSLIGPDADPNHATGQIDAITRHQEIEGFGAAGAWYENWLTAHPQKNELYDLLFGQLGLDIYRLRNTYDISQSNIDNSAEIIAQGESSLGRDLKIMISSWSPPAYLKSDANTVGGTLAKDVNGNYVYAEFAQWWSQSLDAYEANGITADYVNMQNEPDWLASWDTCKFIPTETNDWAGYNLAFEALYNELSTMPDRPKLLAPETAGFGGSKAYIDALIDTNHVYGYAHHLYGDGSGDNPDGFIPGMTSYAAQYGYKPLLQTEYHLADANFTAAMNLSALMHNSLAIEGVSAYLHWELFWEAPGGLVSLDWPWGSNPGYTVNPIYYAFKHYSAFIHSGWQRLEVSNDSPNPRISAYISPDNEQLTVVLINTSSDIDVELNLCFNNFSVADGDVYRTSSSQNCALLGSFDPNNPFTLPAQSITTLALSGTLILTNCQQAQDLGLNLPADLDGDCRVDYTDLCVLVDQWLSTNPVAILPYYSPDIYSDGEINLLDVAVFSIDWVSCNDPQDEDCPQNW